MHYVHWHAWLQVSIVSCGSSWGFRSQQKTCSSVTASHQTLLRTISPSARQGRTQCQISQWVRHGFQHKEPRRCKFGSGANCTYSIFPICLPCTLACHLCSNTGHNKSMHVVATQECSTGMLQLFQGIVCSYSACPHTCYAQSWCCLCT